MAKNFKRQTNIEIIAKDYMDMTGSKSLEELKNTWAWEYYQRELRQLLKRKVRISLDDKEACARIAAENNEIRKLLQESAE